jgi:hypothetical protein
MGEITGREGEGGRKRGQRCRVLEGEEGVEEHKKAEV